MDKVIWVTQLTDFSTKDLEGVGRLRCDKNKGWFRWVYNNSGDTQVVGNALYHGTTTAGFALTGTVYHEEVFKFGQTSKGTAQSTFAGIAMSAAPTADYMWIQVGGIAAAITEGTVAVAATDNLKGVSGQYYLVKDVASGTAPTMGPKTPMAVTANGAGAGTLATTVAIKAIL